MGAEIASAPTARQLRVAVLSADAGQRAVLVGLLEDLGHTVTDIADADAVLADGASVVPDRPPAVMLGGGDMDAAGILDSDAEPHQIDAALRAVAAGLRVRLHMPAHLRFAALEEADHAVLLTPREIEVLVALSEGLSNKAVARRLDISQHTVKFHVESIFRKLGVTTRAEAVAKGLRGGLMHL
jgi:DNA-binding CsgD family transcriptional regulator